MAHLIAGLTAVILYTVSHGLADAFIFRWIRGEDGELYDTPGDHRTAIEAADYNTNWHRAQAVEQGTVLIAIAFLSGVWQIAVIGAGFFWLTHDGLVNVIGLKREFFFVGTTAWIDRLFQRTGHPKTFMAVAKITLLAGGIACFLIK